MYVSKSISRVLY